MSSQQDHQKTQDEAKMTEKLTSLIDLCNPTTENLKLPDILNESIDKIKKLEDLLNNSSLEKDFLEQKNYQLEEELDLQRQDNKQSREQLSIFVDRLKQMLNESRQENDYLKDKIEILEDQVEQSTAVHKYDIYQIDKLSREIEQIEDQKVEVQKKYDQVLLEFWGVVRVDFYLGIWASGHLAKQPIDIFGYIH